MNKCVFVEDAKDSRLKVCSRCGGRMRSDFPAEKCHAVCQRQDPISMAEKSRSLAEAMRKFIQSGAPVMPDDGRKARLNLCYSCPLINRLFGIDKLSECKACGCFIHVKSRMATEHCPIGKWPGDPKELKQGCGSC